MKLNFLLTAIFFTLIGCDFSRDDRISIHQPVNTDSYQLDNIMSDNSYYNVEKISLLETDKIKIGFTAEQVKDILGPGILGDPPFVCLIYTCKDGSSISIFFYELQNKKFKYTGRVTGIYHYMANSKGHFLLPEGLKGKSWNEIMGDDW